MLCTLVATDGVWGKVGKEGGGLGTEAFELSNFSSLAAIKMSPEKAARFGPSAPEADKYQVSKQSFSSV